MTDFAPATVLITGAASGIGAATARLLAERGATLILVDRDFSRFDAPVRARLVTGDVADEALWRDLDLTGLTHAVVNAGIARGGSPIAAGDYAEWRQVLSTNLDGAWLTLSAAMRAIRAGGRGGAVTISSSSAGLKASAGTAPYAVSKAALIHLAKVAAIEGAPDGVRVNAIAPAGVETPIWSDQPFFRQLAEEQGGDEAAYRTLAAGSTLLGRFARPEEVAAQIAFLLSDEAALITGTCLVADGGYTL